MKKKKNIEEQDKFIPFSYHFKGMKKIGDTPVVDYDDVEALDDNIKKKSLFDIIDDIKVHKTGVLLNDEEYMKIFNTYMIIHILSMNNDYCDFVNMINEYQGVLDKKMVYKLLIELIPKGKTFDEYIKQDKIINDETVKYVAEYYEVGLKTSREYIKIMGSEWSNGIKSKFGGTSSFSE